MIINNECSVDKNEIKLTKKHNNMEVVEFSTPDQLLNFFGNK